MNTPRTVYGIGAWLHELKLLLVDYLSLSSDPWLCLLQEQSSLHCHVGLSRLSLSYTHPHTHTSQMQLWTTTHVAVPVLVLETVGVLQVTRC